MKIAIENLQPYEVRLSERKLARVRWMHASGLVVPEPHVVPFDGRYLIIDGNHRTYVAHERNQSVIDVILDSPQETIYANLIINWGVTKISDLTNRIFAHEKWQEKLDRNTYIFLNNFDDELSDDEFFRRYPEIKPFYSPNV